MAVGTFRRSSFVDFPCVAVIARNFRMRAGQLKLRFGVIEGFRFSPSRGLVASLAILTEMSLVAVFRAVAINTFVRSFRECQLRLVAAHARSRGMLVFQGEVRLKMIERVGVEPDDVSLRALMFRMAMAARLGFCKRVLAMKSGSDFPICGDFFVAVEAEECLGFPSKGCVTLVAALLVLLVGFRKRAGHDQFFEQ